MDTTKRRASNLQERRPIRALELDKHAVGAYKTFSWTCSIEPSRIIFQFLEYAETNVVSVEVSGKRKREIGLVDLGNMSLGPSLGKWRECYVDKLQEMKEKYSHFEWRFEKNKVQNCKLPVDVNIAFS